MSPYGSGRVHGLVVGREAASSTNLLIIGSQNEGRTTNGRPQMIIGPLYW